MEELAMINAYLTNRVRKVFMFDILCINNFAVFLRL